MLCLEKVDFLLNYEDFLTANLDLYHVLVLPVQVLLLLDLLFASEDVGVSTWLDGPIVCLVGRFRFLVMARFDILGHNGRLVLFKFLARRWVKPLYELLALTGVELLGLASVHIASSLLQAFADGGLIKDCRLARLNFGRRGVLVIFRDAITSVDIFEWCWFGLVVLVNSSLELLSPRVDATRHVLVVLQNRVVRFTSVDI